MLALFLVFVFGAFVRGKRCAVKSEVCVAEVVQDVIDRKIESLDRSGYYCPDAVGSVTTFVGRIRFIPVRKVVSPKKSATCNPASNAIDML